MPAILRLTVLSLLAWLGLSGCGGGGGDAVVTAAAAAISTVGSGSAATVVADPAVTTPAPAAAAPATDTPAPAEASTTPVVAAPVADTTAPAAAPTVTPAPAVTPAPTVTPTPAATPTPTVTPAPLLLPALQAPPWPRASLTADDLAVLIAEGDPLSEAIGLAYQRARGIPEANMVRVAVPAGSDVISAAAFATLKAAIETKLPAAAQATLVTWTQPSRVQGSCSMGITSALAMGYSASRCGSCSRTEASAYYDSDSTRPATDLQIRPSMMLGAATLEAAQALINRSLAADGSQPAGTGYLLRTADAARSVRYTDYPALPAAWSTAPGLVLRYVDASAAATATTASGLDTQYLGNQTDVLFYFTGLARVPQLLSNHFLPGAAADHLTSYGGLLPGGNGQMPATDWLAAGATASYGTVEEPCNYPEKFSRASVLIAHYLRGNTLIEAYWKSVAWPGQGLFVGDPLARPWNQAPTAVIEGNALVLRTRSMRRGAVYRVDWRAAGSSNWQTLASITAGQPRPITWRVPLPADSAGSQLRWIGPCVTPTAQTGQSCVLGQSS